MPLSDFPVTPSYFPVTLITPDSLSDGGAQLQVQAIREDVASPCGGGCLSWGVASGERANQGDIRALPAPPPLPVVGLSWGLLPAHPGLLRCLTLPSTGCPFPERLY